MVWFFNDCKMRYTPDNPDELEVKSVSAQARAGVAQDILGYDRICRRILRRLRHTKSA